MARKERHKDLKQADSVLTRALNTDPYITAWLVSAMSRLRDHIGSSEDGAHFFHVKGGTSLKLFLDNLVRRSNGSYKYNPDEVGLKPSDWDTQLIINPKLSPRQWVDKFLALDRLITRDLMFLQQEFSTHFNEAHILELANKHIAEFPDGHQEKVRLAKQEATSETAKALIPEFDKWEMFYGKQDVWSEETDEKTEIIRRDLGTEADKKYTSSVLCKYSIRDFCLYRLLVYFRSTKGKLKVEGKKPKYRAELIDITIPRQHTFEALEQWHHTRDIIFSVQLSRETLAKKMDNGETWFQNKFNNNPPSHFYLPIPLHEYHLAEQILMVREHFDPDKEGTKPEKRIARGAAICRAIDEKFAGRIDITGWGKLFPETDKKLHFATLKGGQDSQWPLFLCLLMAQFMEAYDLLTNPCLKGAFDKYFSDKLSGNYKGFKECVEIAHKVSEDMEKAAKALHDYFVKKFNTKGVNLLNQFIQALNSSLLKNHPAAKIAATGSYAACLHLGDPIPDSLYIDTLALDYYDPGGGPENILETSLDIFSAAPATPEIKYEVIKDDIPCIQVNCKDNVTMPSSGGTCTPTFALIRVIKGNPPNLNSAGPNIPVSSLRNLVNEYKNRVASIEEYTVSKRLMEILKKLQDKSG